MIKRPGTCFYFNWVLLLLIVRPVLSQTFNYYGQASSWLAINRQANISDQIGVRYLPGLAFKTDSQHLSIATEVELNLFHFNRIQNWHFRSGHSQVKPYRLWLRIATRQLEARLGLQKINFGAASLLRPLMWFDRMDPRDPLQLTDGVYALLLRYYFLNNTNIWLWGLYGNKDLKGWEFIRSDSKRVEYGGRIQIPTPKGEIALTLHHRQLDLPGSQSPPENRIALDGKWDLGIGLWFETVFVHQDLPIASLRYQRFGNIGLDYTFALGNGLYTAIEAFRLELSDRAFEAGEYLGFTSLMLNYPLGLLDRLSGMFYYDWKNRDWYRFISWQRTYDRWQYFFILFWNPDLVKIYQNQENNLFAGKGIQLMMVFNH